MTQRLEPRFSSQLGASNSDLKALREAARGRRTKRQASTFAVDALTQVEFDIAEQARIDRVQQQTLLQLPDMLNIQQTPPPEERSTGFLGKVLAPFTFLQERVIEPGAGVLTDIAQQVIPGDQEIERKVREFRSQGVGPIEARRRAFVESDLPTTQMSLPFKIPLPANKSLQTFDVGVKGAVELIADPLNLLFGIGTAAKIPGKVGQVVARGMIPEGVRALRGGAKVVPASPGPGIKRKIGPAITPEQLQEAADEAIAAVEKPPTSSAQIPQRSVRDWAQGLLPGLRRRMIPNQRVMRNLRNSKVADANGVPLVVYHGSQNIFETFDPGRATPDALFGPGAYFTENPDVASGYARTAQEADRAPNVTPAFLRIRNPLDMDASIHPLILETLQQSSLLDDVLDAMNLSDLSEIVTNEQGYRALTADYIQEYGTSAGARANINEFILPEMGFDGITHIGGARSRTAPHRVWIALPEVISGKPHLVTPVAALSAKDAERIGFLKKQLEESEYFKEPYGIPEGAIGARAESALLTPAMRGARGFIPPKQLTKEELANAVKEAQDDLKDAQEQLRRTTDADELVAANDAVTDAQEVLAASKKANTPSALDDHKVHVAAYEQYVADVKATHQRFTNEITELEAKASAPIPRIQERATFENQIFGALENQRLPIVPVAEAVAEVVPIPPKPVPSAQFALPGFRSAQADLLDSRIQNIVDTKQADNIHDAMRLAIDQQAADAGLPTGFLPAPLAAHYGAAADDTAGALTEMINMVPGVDAGTQALQKMDGAHSIAAAEMQGLWNAGQRKLRALNFGRWDGKRMVVGREVGEAFLKSLHGERSIPAGFEEVFADLKEILAVEQAKMLAVEPLMAKSFASHPDYFPRMWDIPKATKGTGTIGAKPGFMMPRVEATFTELLDSGLTPKSWNPYDMVALRVIDGENYRAGVQLIDKLKKTGQAVVARDRPSNWRVPDVGPAFTGKMYMDADKVPRKTSAVAVPNRVADVLESMYGKRPTLPIAGRDVLGAIRKFGSTAKRAKLFGSLFQHIDFATRAGAVAFSPGGIMRGLPLKYPSLIARLMNVSLRKAPREALTKKILSDAQLYDDFDISLRKVAENGWQIGGDLSMFRRGIMDFVEDVGRSGPVGSAAIAARRMKSIATFMEDSLFDGVYRETQAWSLENYIIPSIRKNHKDWNADQVAASAAAEVNKMFSTLGPWQSWFTHPSTRELAHAMIFSTNESESWIRAATSTVKGPNKKLWQDYSLGMMIFMGMVANTVNFQATGESLPIEAYSPITTNAPYAFLGGMVGYNTKFLSPQVTVAGRGEVPLYLDVVGQADTFFRWLLDPPGALTARYNVLPRAVMNQAQGHDFMGRPIEGLRDRTVQALDDLVLPIGPGYFSDVIREQIPVTQDVLAVREPRLGMLGSMIQSTGLNLRAISTPDMLDRVANLSGFQTADGQPVRAWSELEPAQRRALQDSPELSAELQRRDFNAINRGNTGAEIREQHRAIDDARLDQERALQSMFITGEVRGRDTRVRYDQIQSDAVAKRSQLSADFQRFYNESIEPENKNDLALVQFYQVHEAARNAAGIYDGDIAAKGLANLERTWTPEQIAFVERNTGLTEHPEILAGLRTGRRKFGSYWRVHEMVLNNDPAAIERYEEFIGIFGEPRKEILQQFPELADASRVVSATRERMRMLSPELDVFLFQWGYTGTLAHPDNEGRERELAPWTVHAMGKFGLGGV
jgi:hypothetical protein